MAESYDHLSVLAIRQGQLGQAHDLIRQAMNLEPENSAYQEQEARLREALRQAA